MLLKHKPYIQRERHKYTPEIMQSDANRKCQIDKVKKGRVLNRSGWRECRKLRNSIRLGIGITPNEKKNVKWEVVVRRARWGGGRARQAWMTPG